MAPAPAEAACTSGETTPKSAAAATARSTPERMGAWCGGVVMFACASAARRGAGAPIATLAPRRYDASRTESTMPGKKVRFSAYIQSIRGGGGYVVVPDEVAERAGLRFRDRVRGVVAGEPYRASLAKYSGEFHVAVLKSAMIAAGLSPGDEVPLTIERDAEP